MKKKIFGLFLALFGFVLQGDMNAYVVGKAQPKDQAKKAQEILRGMVGPQGLQSLAKDQRKGVANSQAVSMSIKVTPAVGLGKGQWMAYVIDSNGGVVGGSPPIDRASASPFEMKVTPSIFPGLYTICFFNLIPGSGDTKTATDMTITINNDVASVYRIPWIGNVSDPGAGMNGAAQFMFFAQ